MHGRDSYGPLPALLAEIAEVAGLAAAIAVADARGGTRAYIPAPERLTPRHWLVTACGVEAATAIARHFAARSGIYLPIPLGPCASGARQTRRLAALIDEGRSRRDIALALKISERTVARHRKRRADDAQADLFAGDR